MVPLDYHKYGKYRSRYRKTREICEREEETERGFNVHPCRYSEGSRRYLSLEEGPSRGSDSSECVCTQRGQLVRRMGIAGLRAQLRRAEERTRELEGLHNIMGKRAISLETLPEDLKARFRKRFGDEGYEALKGFLAKVLKYKPCNKVAQELHTGLLFGPSEKDIPPCDYETEAKPFYEWCIANTPTHSHEGELPTPAGPMDADKRERLRKGKIRQDTLAVLKEAGDPNVEEDEYINKWVDDVYKIEYPDSSPQ